MSGGEGPRFWLAQDVLGRDTKLPLTEEEFRDLRLARALLLDQIGAEGSLALLLENYVEFQETLLRGALESSLFTHSYSGAPIGHVHVVDRRLTNLLASCRSYIDSVKRTTSSRFGPDSDELQRLKGWFSEEYDARIGYRAMEALRNYALHRGRAVHQLATTSWWVDDKRTRMRLNMYPSVKPAELRRDGKFKKAVLEDLSELGEVVDLGPLVDEYVTGIAAVHRKNRESLQAEIEKAEDLLMSAITKYHTEGGGDVIGLAAVQEGDGGRWLEIEHINEGLVTHRRKLAERHRFIRDLVRQFVTSEPKETPGHHRMGRPQGG